MESSNVYTSSIRDQRNCRRSSTKSEGRNISRIPAGRIGLDMVGLILWNAIAICETSKPSWRIGKPLYERRFGEPIKGPIIPFGTVAEHHPISMRDQSRLHQFGKKVPSGICQDIHCLRMKFGKETFRLLQNWRNWTHQKFVHDESMSKKYWSQQKGEEYKFFAIADGTARLSRGVYESREPTLRRKRTVRSEDSSGELPHESDAMPCKKEKHLADTRVRKLFRNFRKQTKYGCIVESHASTRPRAELSQPKNHKDHFAGNGYTSMTHLNLVCKFIPMPQAMKNPDAKAAVDKEWKKLETIPVWQLEKVQSKKEVILAAQRDKKKSPHCHIDGHMSPQKRWIRTQITEIQRTGRTPWWRPRKTFGRRFKVTSWSSSH